MKQLCLFAALVLSLGANAQKPKPNIIYIYADDLGYGELGSYGQTKIKTPNLDKLAAEGMRFTQHYSSAPVCAPSRCMLMTGKHGGHSYIRGNYELGGFTDSTEGGQMPLHEGAYTVARMLKERGYTTALVGKWGMGVTGTTRRSPGRNNAGGRCPLRVVASCRRRAPKCCRNLYQIFEYLEHFGPRLARRQRQAYTAPA
jgi:arylsulfatase A-like enzyme